MRALSRSRLASGPQYSNSPLLLLTVCPPAAATAGLVVAVRLGPLRLNVWRFPRFVPDGGYGSGDGLLHTAPHAWAKH